VEVGEIIISLEHQMFFPKIATKKKQTILVSKQTEFDDKLLQYVQAIYPMQRTSLTLVEHQRMLLDLEDVE
jgi:hypothetical protein